MELPVPAHGTTVRVNGMMDRRTKERWAMTVDVVAPAPAAVVSLAPFAPTANVVVGLIQIWL